MKIDCLIPACDIKSAIDNLTSALQYAKNVESLLDDSLEEFEKESIWRSAGALEDRLSQALKNIQEFNSDFLNAIIGGR